MEDGLISRLALSNTNAADKDKWKKFVLKRSPLPEGQKFADSGYSQTHP
jgi:hypothetical protein